MNRSLVRSVPWLVGLVGLIEMGCAGDRGAPAQTDRSALVANAEERDEIVALVDGRPVRASAVAAQAKAAGTDARKALSDLIELELLAGVAVDRGLLADPDVVQARKAEEARRLLELDFEPSTPLDRVPDADLRKRYLGNKLYFDREESVEVWHLLAVAPDKGPPEARRIAREQLRALLPRASTASSDEAFAALATQAAAPAEPGAVPMKAEQITFPRRGVVEAPFADAAFALAAPGAVTGPVETSYGLHLIRLVKRVPARHVSFEDARAELRPGVWTGWRRRELDRYLRDLMEKWSVQVHEGRLLEPASEQ